MVADGGKRVAPGGSRRSRRAGAWLACALGAAVACRSGVQQSALLQARGLDRLAAGDTVAARALFEAASYHAPGEPELLAIRAMIARSEGTIAGRARAEAMLRRAVDLAPTVGRYRGALGELLHEQGFHRESAGALVAAVRLDSTLGRAWFCLGLEMQGRFFDEPDATAWRDSALDCYARALGADPGDDEARYRTAFLHFARGDLEAARRLLQARAYGRDCPGRFAVLLAAIECRAHRFEAAAGPFAAAFTCAAPAEREALVGLRAVLHPDSVPAYEQQSAAARDSLLHRFWWRRDPTPATALNERLLEHVARVVEADFWFDVPLLRQRGSRTDRGETWLRYGEPQIRRRCAEHAVPAWHWVYGDSTQRDEFVFLDRTLNGNYIRTRRHAGSDFMRPERQEREPERTRILFAPPPDRVAHAVRRFRGRDGRMALEIACEVPLEPAARALRVRAAAWRDPERSAGELVQDLSRDALHPIAAQRAVGRVRFEVAAEPLVLGLQVMALHGSPGAEAAVDAAVDAAWMAASRDTLAAARFPSEALGLSDVLLAYAIEDGHGGPFDMGGILVTPRVAPVVDGGQVLAYFEIYPTREILRRARPVDVTWRVQGRPPRWRFRDQFRGRDREPPPAVQATFAVQVHDATERQRLAIDVRNLDPGDYELTVEVQDAVGSEPASSSTRFTIPGASNPP